MRKTLLVLLILLLPSCGKKRRNFFTYQEKNVNDKFNRLTLPSIKGLHLDNDTIRWVPIKHGKFIGYNVYKFPPGKFIPKNPVNVEPLKSTNFVTKSKTKRSYCYVIRGVFSVENKLTEGPTSKIIHK